MRQLIQKDKVERTFSVKQSVEEQIKEARYGLSRVRVDLKITVYGPEDVQVLLDKERLASWVETLVADLFPRRVYKTSLSSHTIVEKVNTKSSAISLVSDEEVFRESVEQDGLYSPRPKWTR